MPRSIQAQIAKLEEEKKKAIDGLGEQQQRRGDFFYFLYKNEIEDQMGKLRKKIGELGQQQDNLRKAHFQPLEDYLQNNTRFHWQEIGGYRLYKFLTENWKSPYQGFQYKLGGQYHAEMENDQEVSHGRGLDVGTLEWVVNAVHSSSEFDFPNTILVACLVPKVPSLEYCIPLREPGKISVNAFQIKENIPWSKLVHDCARCRNKFISEDPCKVGFSVRDLTFCNDSCRQIYKKAEGYISCNECKDWYKRDRMYNEEFCSERCEHDFHYTTCSFCHEEFEKGDGVWGDTYCSIICTPDDYDD